VKGSKELKKLVVISERYPTAGDPVFTFVDNLLVQLKGLGVDIRVISPQSASRRLIRGGVQRPGKWERQTEKGSFTVHQPFYVSTGTLLPGLNHRLYVRAVKHEMRAIIEGGFLPDAGYAHFWRSGIAGAAALPEGLKVFVACGESEVKPELEQGARAMLPKLGGVISVSSKNREDCIRMYGVSPERIAVLPNGVSPIFCPPDPGERLRTREDLGILEDELAVIFVGWFNERKGVKRLEAALKGLDGVKALYVGSGPMPPQGDNIAFSGQVEHDQLPKLLGAADVFVLPTLAEGCCNAIVEAMACGLPVISSLGAFNDDLLHEDDSIRVDPMDVQAIRSAVLRLKEDGELRVEMGARALAFARDLDVGRRAARIKAFIQERM
jgi:teichuronic acid biosynthesis glycosyltransferase TuaC